MSEFLNMKNVITIGGIILSVVLPRLLFEEDEYEVIEHEPEPDTIEETPEPAEEQPNDHEDD